MVELVQLPDDLIDASGVLIGSCAIISGIGTQSANRIVA